MISRDQIAALIPHAGAMCLLDRVLHWDDVAIRCISLRHRAQDNPLRRDGRISAICGIEFAVQAMAVHGRLTGGSEGKPRAGYLASVRNVLCRQDRLDLPEGDLIIDAERLIGDERRTIYHFALQVGDIAVLSGQTAVVLEVAD